MGRSKRNKRRESGPDGLDRSHSVTTPSPRRSDAGSRTGDAPKEAEDAPFLRTRLRDRQRAAQSTLELAFDRTAASASSTEDGPPYALRVRVELSHRGSIPAHLWNEGIIDDVLQHAGLPPAGELVLLGEGDFLWYRLNRRTRDGLVMADAEDHCNTLANIHCWFRPDLPVMVNGAPVPLGIANRAAGNATPRQVVSAPNLTRRERRQARKDEKRREHRRRKSPSEASSQSSRSSHGSHGSRGSGGHGEHCALSHYGHWHSRSDSLHFF